jgi:hypothetical protein
MAAHRANRTAWGSIYSCTLQKTIDVRIYLSGWCFPHGR